MRRLSMTLGSLVAALPVCVLGADTWQINMTVDNQFDAYVGTASATAGTAVGSGSNWATTSSFTVNGMQASDFFYVATASDWSVAQGFLGEFNNTTQNLTFHTGTSAWEVFPVGAYLQQIDSSWPASWPQNLMPTQGQVDQALAFGAANPSVWVTPSEFQNWDNRVTGNITTWGHRSGIDASSEWIWHNTGSGNPFNPGINHDEFLLFRVRGVPAPGALSLLATAGMLGVRRRRSGS